MNNYSDDIERLRKNYKLITRLVALLFILFFLISWLIYNHFSIALMDAQNPQVLTLNELNIVDQNGTPRVTLAAPLPEPIMLGKRFKRGEAVSGILIFDAEGNERGGYVTGDISRGAALTLDEVNRASVHIASSARGEMHFQLSNGQGQFINLAIQPDEAFLRLQSGRDTLLLIPK